MGRPPGAGVAQACTRKGWSGPKSTTIRPERGTAWPGSARGWHMRRGRRPSVGRAPARGAARSHLADAQRPGQVVQFIGDLAVQGRDEICLASTARPGGGCPRRPRSGGRPSGPPRWRWPVPGGRRRRVRRSSSGRRTPRRGRLLGLPEALCGGGEQVVGQLVGGEHRLPGPPLGVGVGQGGAAAGRALPSGGAGVVGELGGDRLLVHGARTARRARMRQRSSGSSSGPPGTVPSAQPGGDGVGWAAESMKCRTAIRRSPEWEPSSVRRMRSRHSALRVARAAARSRTVPACSPGPVWRRAGSGR